EAHKSLLHITATTGETAETLDLALLGGGLHGSNFDLEQQFDGSLDFRLGGIRRHDENDLLVLVGDHGCLLRNLRRDRHLQQTFLIELAHARISSILLTAPLVKTTLGKRISDTGSA